MRFLESLYVAIVVAIIGWLFSIFFSSLGLIHGDNSDIYAWGSYLCIVQVLCSYFQSNNRKK